MTDTVYTTPLTGRYTSARMSALFSSATRIQTWRHLWIALAEAEKDCGLGITEAQISALKNYAHDLNLDVAADIERTVRHDVMAQVKAYGLQAPEAAGIIHLGATSCYVTDNADLIIYRDALRLLADRVVDVLRALRTCAHRHRALPTLGYTHMQPAQLTTVGKRVSLWLQDFEEDLHTITHCLSTLKFRGVKGTTGTQASFLSLFNGDHEKVQKLDALVAKKCGFTATYPVCGQTYPRKLDARILHVLVGIALSASKMTNDIRYLQSVGEMEEPFARNQIGSSAMAYKRNPMRCERADSLARLIISLSTSPEMTAATQFLERTLDDSANRRIVLPEAFLAADAVLLLIADIASGLTVYPHVIAQRVADALPFMATETFLMMAVARGKNRQTVHEAIRQHAMAATENVRKGKPNDLLERLADDPAIGISREEIDATLNPKAFTGRAKQQVEEYLNTHIAPLLKKYRRHFPKDDACVHV